MRRLSINIKVRSAVAEVAGFLMLVLISDVKAAGVRLFYIVVVMYPKYVITAIAFL